MLKNKLKIITLIMLITLILFTPFVSVANETNASDVMPISEDPDQPVDSNTQNNESAENSSEATNISENSLDTLKESDVYLYGDNVVVDIKTKTIEKVEARRNYLERPLVANIDKLLIVMSTSIPSFSDYLIDKFLLIAFENKIEPIIIITKVDMITQKEKSEIKRFISYYRKLGIKVYLNTSISKIKKEFVGSVVALCGQTGAGKSSLLNKIDASLKLKTGEVSLSLGRGKHTTRLVELLEVNNGLISNFPFPFIILALLSSIKFKANKLVTSYKYNFSSSSNKVTA